MSTLKRPFSLRLHGCAALVALALAAPAALAQVTDISDEPLAQPATNIKPNVVMILDDSGSMREQYTPDYLGSLFGSAEELCFDSKDSDGDIDANLLDCEVGDPPMMSSQVNYQYYNPQIRYLPAVNYDGTSRPNMDAVATSNWTKVPTDNVSSPGKNTFRVSIMAMNNGGNAETTTDLTTKWPDRAFCTAKGDDHKNTANYPSKCRLNSQYSYPNQNFGYGRDGSNNIKYVYGAPYYYILHPTEWCTDATLTNCSGTQNATYSVPAPLRFCSDTTLANCQGKLTGSYVRPKYTGIVTGGAQPGAYATATITIRNPQSDGYSGTVQNILINGQPAIASPLNFGGPISASAAATAIAGAINAGPQSADFTASASNNVVTITSNTQTSVYNGYTVSVVAPGTPVSAATVNFDILDADRNSDKVTSVKIGTTEILGTTITCSWGTGCTQSSQSGRDNWMGSAVAAAINSGTASHGYSATTSSGGSNITVIAPAGTGGELNGQPLTVTEQGIVNVTGKSLSGGASSGDVENTTTSFTGGQDANAGRTATGDFERINIVPFVGIGESESYQPSFGLLSKEEVKLGQSWGQEFKHNSATATYNVDRIAVVMYRDPAATPGQTITISLANNWSSPAIASGTISSDNLGLGFGWQTITLATPVTLNDNQAYVVRVDNAGPGLVYIGYHDASIYTNGDLLNNGSKESGKALSFQVTGGVPATYNRYSARTDCAASRCTYAEEMTNFANWYAYYRSRMQMAKTAIGRAFRAIDDSYRIGFITINPGSPVQADRYVKVDNFDTTQRQTWYTHLYDQEDHGSTPLREALSRVGRYFAGVTSGINSGMDGSPITASCQPNYSILTTDGYWNGNAGQDLSGGSIGNQDNVDAGYSTRAVGAYDGGGGKASNTLADVAMYYYKNDLRTDLDDFSPTTQNDSAPHQHMVTYTVGLGLAGLLNYDPNYQTQTTGDFVAIKQGTKDWPVPSADSESALDDLWHAAVNARGTFFSTRDPVTLTNGIIEALSAVQKRVGAGAAAATSNLQPVAGDNFAFTAQYQTVSWTGDLKARTIDLASGIVASRELWSAALLLDQRSHTDRHLYMFDGSDNNPPTSGNGNLLKAFCWPGASGTGLYPGCDAAEGELSAAEMAWFDPTLLTQYGGWTTDGSGRDTFVSAQKLVDFLRGDQANETTGGAAPTDLFRNRESLLGDIVNAQPAYVKASPFFYNIGANAGKDPYYQEYKQTTDGTVSTRKGTVFGAANDGMLHAFETDPDNNPYYQTGGIATTQTSDDTFTGTLNTSPDVGEGSERWAFIPSMVGPGLKNLAETPLLFIHKYYTDGTPTVGDVCYGHSTASPCSAQTNWHTILVAGLNAGGRGYYALDISDPDNPKGLWEFKGGNLADPTTCGLSDAAIVGYTSDCNLGFSFGTPVIAKRKVDGKWVVIVTSGHNNVNPGDGKGYLYLLDAQTGAILQRIGTGVGCDGISTTAPCALGTPDPSGLNKLNAWVDDAAFDNTALTVYAGDLKGNLWRFQLDPSEAGYGTAYKLTTLLDPTNNPQPITTKPELGEISNYRVVFIGTGKLLGTTDLTTTQQQTIWAIRDDLTSDAIDLRGGDLVQQTLSPNNNPGGDPATERTTTANPVDFNTKKGWFVDLPDAGERVNVDPVLQLGTLAIPSNNPTSDACVAGGYGWINFLDFRTGAYVPGATANTASNRIAASLIVGINVVQLPGGEVKTIVTTADNQQLTEATPVNPPSIEGKRVSWRELIVQ